MKKNTFMKTMTTFGLGALMGMMVAPKEGEELRKDVKCTVKKASKKMKNSSNDVKETIKDALESIGEKIEDLDFEESKKDLTKKAESIKNELEKIIKDAREAKDDIVENTAMKLKEGLANKLEDLSDKLKD